MGAAAVPAAQDDGVSGVAGAPAEASAVPGLDEAAAPPKAAPSAVAETEGTGAPSSAVAESEGAAEDQAGLEAGMTTAVTQDSSVEEDTPAPTGAEEEDETAGTGAASAGAARAAAEVETEETEVPEEQPAPERPEVRDRAITWSSPAVQDRVQWSSLAGSSGEQIRAQRARQCVAAWTRGLVAERCEGECTLSFAVAERCE